MTVPTDTPDPAQRGTPAWRVGLAEGHVGDARSVLAAMEPESVHLAITSPPFYALRKYSGEQEVVWGGDPNHAHTFTRRERPGMSGGIASPKVQIKGTDNFQIVPPSEDGTCECGAYLCALGLERVPDCGAALRGEPPCGRCYICHLREIFAGVWRVLRRDGVCVIEIGDSYSGSGKAHIGNGHDKQDTARGTLNRDEIAEVWGRDPRGATAPGLKAKDLCLIPQRLALALQADGWTVRSVAPWLRRSAMPECLVPDTRVFIREGDRVRCVTLDDIFLGGEPYPEILTPTGWLQIEAAWETVKESAINFEAGKVANITASAEHRWPVSHDRRRVVTHEKTTEALRDSGYNDYLLHYAIEPWLAGCLKEYAGHVMDYELGWMLGLYAAEGGFGETHGYRCKLTLHADENVIADQFCRGLESRFPCSIQRRTIARYQDIRFSSRGWYDLARSLVLGNVRTKHLNMDVVLNTPREFRQGLWDGWIVGDGSDRKVGVSGTSASVELRDGMSVVASSIGIITSKRRNVQPDERTGKTYVSYQLWTPYLTRRKAKKQDTARQITIRNKRVVEGPIRMIDLQVDGRLFLIEDGIATHNSVQDRPSSALSWVIMLAKGPRYWWDAVAVARTSATGDPRRPYTSNGAWQLDGRPLEQRHSGQRRDGDDFTARAFRNTDPYFDSLDLAIEQAAADLARLKALKASGGILADCDGVPLAQDVNPEPSSLAHFASFPTRLIRPWIRAACPERVCAACGRGWTRVVEREVTVRGDVRGANGTKGMDASNSWQGWPRASVRATTLGFRPACTCDADTAPGVTLDIFAGSGTTALACNRLGRRSISVDLSPEYAEMSRRRLEGDSPMLNRLQEQEHTERAEQAALF